MPLTLPDNGASACRALPASRAPPRGPSNNSLPIRCIGIAMNRANRSNSPAEPSFRTSLSPGPTGGHEVSRDFSSGSRIATYCW